MGRATDKGDEFPPPHGAPKAKDHDLIITPRIAARSGHLCPLRVSRVGLMRRRGSRHIRFTSIASELWHGSEMTRGASSGIARPHAQASPRLPRKPPHAHF